MKTTILLLFLALAQSLSAARYFVNGGANNNWGTTGNWSLTDGGAGGQAVPLATDDCFFTANSPNVTVDTSTRVCKTLDFTGYTGNITMTFGINVSGSITLSPTMSVSGSGTLASIATGTLTSNGKTWPAAFSLTTTNVVSTLADNWTVSGPLTLGPVTINGSQLTHTGDLTITTTTGITQGTTLLRSTGTGTITLNFTTGSVRVPWTINTAGTLTFAGVGLLPYNTGTFTYVAGTIVGASGVTLSLNAAATTFAVSGITWGAITVAGSNTYTLSEDLNTSGLLTIGSTTQAPILNGHVINTAGGFRYNGTSGLISGTTVIKLTGTGTVDAPSITSGRVANPITFAAGSGTVTVTGFFPIDLSLLTFTSGTVITNNTWASTGSTNTVKGYTFQ